MSYRPSLRVQLTTIITVVAFMLATMAPLSASPRRVSSAKPPAARPAEKSGSQSLSAYVQASATTAAGGATTFTGLLTVTGFQATNGVLNAVATLTGSAIDPGSTQQTASIVIPVLSVDPSCQILTLSLGALDVNLLGLVVHLNPVFLTITAVPGAGNLLGNLLCAVANLLNGGLLSTLLSDLVSLLNQILAALAAL